jgi:predicted nucleic acid-binding protein
VRVVRVFADTNVILDVLLRREPFAADAARIWSLAEANRIQGLVSAVSFTTLYYITRRSTRPENAVAAVKLVRSVFHPIVCNEAIIDEAIDSGFSDFEDAIQYFSARSAGADVIVTRNTRHFPAGDLPVMSPAAFLETHRFH